MADYIDIDTPIDVAVYQRNRRIQVTLRQILESNDAKYQPADVRPVVRASWEEKEKDGVRWYACSVCGEHIPKGRWGQEWHSNYCPNCGADMRLQPPKEET